MEVKYDHQKAGDRRPWVKGRKAKTLVILLRGKIVQYFADCVIVLEKEGDYALFGPGVSHASEVLEDSTVMTIRWPSVP